MSAATEPVRPGTAIVAFIEPHAGLAREFNEWYERDHFYDALMAGPGACAAARYVATRACKDQRRGTGHLADPARGSYLTLAWLLPGLQEEWDAWVGRRMAGLRDDPARLFAGRDHLYTAVYGFAWDVRSVDTLVPIVALDRDFAGVVALTYRGSVDAARTWAESIVGPELPLVVGMVPERTVLAEVEPGEHVLVVGFCDADPCAVWAQRLAPVVGESVQGGGPFLRTVPGTDAYVDEL